MTNLLTPIGLALLIAVIFLLIGYWMGRNSAERPFRSVEGQDTPLDNTPPEDLRDGEGGYIEDAIYDPDEVEEDDRIETIGG